MANRECDRAHPHRAALTVAALLVIAAVLATPAQASARTSELQTSQVVTDMTTRLNIGGTHTCSVAAGRVACWGRNAYGQLGDGTTVDRLAPTPVAGISNATAVAAGSNHTCALISDGTARCWGYAGNGAVGDGTTGDANRLRRTPVQVVGLTGATQISSGNAYSCALLSNQTVKCWGLNRAGSVGDGTTTRRFTPVAVSGLSGVKALSSAFEFTCALLTTGSIKCWGLNQTGQLGDGTQVDRYTPVAVAGVTNAIAVTTAGSEWACAVLATGTVKCWGWNTGVIGPVVYDDSQPYWYLTPTAIPGLSGVTDLDAGSGHACALMNDATVRCWGTANSGQIGDGSYGDANYLRYTPTTVPSLTNVIGVEAGGDASCALLGDGSVRCWGGNMYGQLGDGTKTTRKSPVPTVPGTALGAPTNRWTLSRTIQASWTGATSGAPIARYDTVRRAGSWNGSIASAGSPWLSGTTGTSGSFTGSLGATYCIRARATDVRSVVGTYSDERCTAIPLRSDQASYSSGWTKTTFSSAYAGFYYRTTLVGAKVTRTGIEAKRIAVIASRCPTCGSVKVYWNGAYQKTVALTASTTQRKQVVELLTFSAPAKGTLSLVVSTSGKPVVIEGLGISKSIA